MSLILNRYLVPLVLAAGLATAAASPAFAESGPWPGFHGTSTHTGLGTSSGPRSLTLAWYVPTTDDVDNSAVIASDGSIYIASTDGTILALNPDGSQKWSQSAGARIYGSPALDQDGKVLIGDQAGRGAETGRLRALNPSDGSTAWVLTGLGTHRGTPAVAADGTIYIGTDRGELLAVDANGVEKYRRQALDAVVGAPAIDGRGFVFWGSLDGHLRRMTPGGDVTWDVLLDGQIVSAPAVAPDGMVYVGAGSSLLAINSESGAVVWRVGYGAPVATTPAIGPDGTVYAGADNGLFNAVTPAGKVRWQFQAGGAIRSSAAVGPDGLVYFGSGDAIVYVLDASGQRLSTYRALDAVHGAVTLGPNGAIYVGSRDNRFYALTDTARRFTESPADRLGGDLIRDPSTGKVYAIADGRRRHIPDPVTQSILGLAGPLPQTATTTELLRYPEGPALPELREGSLVRAANGPVYVIRSALRVWIKSAEEFAAAGYSWDAIVPLDDRTLRSIGLKPEDGFLLKGAGDQVYLVAAGQKRWISSGAAFAAGGYSWAQVHFVAEATVAGLPDGPQL
jgi:outer membrane protein assembly factor BamB